MMIKPNSLLHALALAALTMSPTDAAAQGARSTAPAARSAPVPRTAAPPAAPQTTSSAAARRPWHEQDYRLGAGDKIRVEVYGEPQLSQSLQVRPDGKITIPLIGDIVATNRTSLELTEVIAAALKEYVTNPVVTVILQEAVAAQVHIVGEVARPGPLVMQGPLTVLQALSQAGGPGEFAKTRDIRILRRTGTATTSIPFDYKAALKGQVEPMFLEPGDTIVVP
jgi:polysaccharide export outer membrane protein